MSRMVIYAVLLVILSGIVVGCRTTPLPTKKVYAFYQYSKVRYFEDSIVISLDNPVNSPLRYFLSSSSDVLNQRLEPYDTVVLRPLQDSIIVIDFPNDKKSKVKLINRLGDPSLQVNNYPVSLPLSVNKRSRILQAYNGSYTHNHIYSQYAIDFQMDVGDTICSVDDGYVVGVIENYSGHGGEEWRSYANYIRVYHPKSHLYTEYVHLDTNGSLVELGDTVAMGQAIGICGMTGYTDYPHLHFNVERCTQQGLISEKVNFIEGYKGEDLKRNSRVIKRAQ